MPHLATSLASANLLLQAEREHGRRTFDNQGQRPPPDSARMVFPLRIIILPNVVQLPHERIRVSSFDPLPLLLLTVALQVVCATQRPNHMMPQESNAHIPAGLMDNSHIHTKNSQGTRHICTHGRTHTHTGSHLVVDRRVLEVMRPVWRRV